MDSVNKTLFIPLYGRALVSQKGIILKDEHAQRIWCQNKFKLKGKSKSKWLAYYMGMRSAVFDDWVKTGRRYFAEYGQQRAWQKASVLKEVKDDGDGLPF